MAETPDWKSLLATRLRPLEGHDEKHLERGDHDLNPHLSGAFGEDVPLRPAAVLVPVIDRPTGLTVLFTRRAEHLSAHAGQVSFPGGRVEPFDESTAATALRETREEIGLLPSFVTLIGALDVYVTVSGFRVHPFVGLVRPDFTLDVDTREVADVFEVSFGMLMERANHRRHQTVWQGHTRTYYVIAQGGHEIWGATAGMIVNLSDLLATGPETP